MDRDLEIAALASVGGLSKARSNHLSRLGQPCANCDTTLQGPYCYVCGQLAEDFDRSVVSLFVEAFENIFHADGRLFRTLPALILKPATLTRNYLAGRRASQMPPLRLFLVVMLVFFLVGSVRDLVHPKFGAVAARTTTVPSHVALGSGSKIQALGDWLMPRVNYASTHKREFSASIDSWLHRIAIIFLPIATLLLALLFVFQRRFFLFEHAIFSMHSLSFMGLLFAAIGLILLIPGVGSAADLLILTAPIHLFAHMRGVYRTSVLWTLVRMALLLVLSGVSIALLFLGVFAWELNALAIPPA